MTKNRRINQKKKKRPFVEENRFCVKAKTQHIFFNSFKAGKKQTNKKTLKGSS